MWLGLELLLKRVIFTVGFVWFGCGPFLVSTYLVRKVMLKERIKGLYLQMIFYYRAFGEQEDDVNSVGSNSLGGALADYNMQVRIHIGNITNYHA